MSILALVLALAIAPTSGSAKIVAQLPTQADAAQHYDLYLPAGYPGAGRRWPVLLILDPRGRADWALRMAQSGAEANGWIVLSSHDSRSDGPEQRTLDALQALLHEIATRYAYDPRRVYVAGMSGTAKSLWVADASLHGLVAGYIGACGGRPPELGALPRQPPDFFGFTGERDFNFQEMRELDAALAGKGGRHRLQVFEGGHGWPPEPQQFAGAIDWLELAAMREGRTPRREPWIDARLQAARAAATVAPSALERGRGFDQIARDFEGLRDTGPDRSAATRWLADPEARRLLAVEKRLREEENRFIRQLDDWATRFGTSVTEGLRSSPPDLARSLSELRLRSLRARAADPEPMVAASALRRLERLYAAGAHYLADAQQARGDRQRTRLALQLGLAAFPERPYPRCRLARLEAHPVESLDAATAACGSQAVENSRD